jgi:hypothetical protein
MCSWLGGLCKKPEGHGFDSRQDRWMFFSLPNPSSSTMALGFTQPLTEMNTRDLLCEKVPPARKVDNLTAICEQIVSQP